MQFEDILDFNVASNWTLSDEDKAVNQFLSERIDLDLSEPDWSFDYLSFWVRKDNGQILYSTDSGCSCPMPYEDHKVSDLLEVSLSRIPALIEAHVSDYGYNATRIRQQARTSLYNRLIEFGANHD